MVSRRLGATRHLSLSSSYRPAQDSYIATLCLRILCPRLLPRQPVVGIAYGPQSYSGLHGLSCPVHFPLNSRGRFLVDFQYECQINYDILIPC
jgi:hypothetical protein